MLSIFKLTKYNKVCDNMFKDCMKIREQLY